MSMKVYIINGVQSRRGTSRDRILAMSRQMHVVQHPHTGPDSSPLPPCPYWRDTRNPKLMTNGELGCFAGHYHAWTLVAESGEPAIIVEDDAEFARGLPDHYPGSASEASLYYLAYKRLEDWPNDDEDREWRSAPLCWWALAYTLTPSAANRLIGLSHALGWAIPVDELIPLAGLGRVTENRLEHLPESFAPRVDLYCAREPYAWPSGEESSTDNHAYAFDLKTVVFGTERRKASALLDQLRQGGHDPILLGEGEPGWDTSGEGGRPKLEWLRQHMERDENLARHVYLCMDGYDVECKATPQDVLRIYGGLRWPCVVSGERSYWPERGMRNLWAPGDYGDDDFQGGEAQPYQFACSGVFAGGGGALLRSVAKALDEHPDEADDQALMQHMVQADYKLWRVDDGGALAHNFNGAENDLDDSGLNTVTGTLPLIFHRNGPSKAAPRESDRLARHGAFAGSSVSMIRVATDIYAVPLLSPEDAHDLSERLLAVPDGEWASLPEDNVPGDELRHDILAPLREMIDAELPGLLRQVWPLVEWKVSDIFAIRHTADRQRALRLHHDISLMSGSIKLRDAECGGALWFPRQGFDDRNIESGCAIFWPSRVTHPHTTTPVEEGMRLAVTVWTEGG